MLHRAVYMNIIQLRQQLILQLIPQFAQARCFLGHFLAGKAVGAKIVLPAFGDRRFLPAWEKACAPAKVTLERSIEF